MHLDDTRALGRCMARKRSFASNASRSRLSLDTVILETAQWYVCAHVEAMKGRSLRARYLAACCAACDSDSQL